jgi:hypothetical protein
LEFPAGISRQFEFCQRHPVHTRDMHAGFRYLAQSTDTFCPRCLFAHERFLRAEDRLLLSEEMEADQRILVLNPKHFSRQTREEISIPLPCMFSRRFLYQSLASRPRPLLGLPRSAPQPHFTLTNSSGSSQASSRLKDHPSPNPAQTGIRTPIRPTRKLAPLTPKTGRQTPALSPPSPVRPAMHAAVI